MSLQVCFFSEHNNCKTFIKSLYISQYRSFNFHRVCSLFRSALSDRAQTSKMIDLDGNRCRNWRGNCRRIEDGLVVGCLRRDTNYLRTVDINVTNSPFFRKSTKHFSQFAIIFITQILHTVYCKEVLLYTYLVQLLSHGSSDNIAILYNYQDIWPKVSVVFFHL